MNGVSAELRRTLKRLGSSPLSWREIGEIIGETKGWAWLVAHGEISVAQERAEEIMGKLSEYNTDSIEQQAMRVWEIARKRPGPKNAILQREVARRVGIRVRDVRFSTLWLLGEGYPIGTTLRPPYGIYRMTKEEHKKAYIAQLQSRITGTAHRVRLVKRLNLNETQMEMALG